MISINYIATFLLVVFSGYFLDVISLSPIYLSFVVGIYGIILYCIWRKKFLFNYVQYFAFIFIVYIFISQILFMQNKDHATINVMFSLIYLIVSFIGLSSLTREKILKIAKYFIYVSLPILIFEAVYRILNPIIYIGNETTPGLSYYKYKYNSVMFEDSNYVGVFIMCLFFLCVYLEHNDKIKLKIPKIILAILTVATFSKAAIATLLIFFILFDLRLSKFMKIIIIALGALGGLSIFIKQVLLDGSLAGKIGIVSSAIQYLKGAPPYRVLFGVGFGNSKTVLSIGAHNMIVAYIIESGVVGLCMLLILWILILKYSKGKVAVLMFPLFMVAMSLIGHAIPFVYCSYAIVCVLEAHDYSQETELESLGYQQNKTLVHINKESSR